MSGAGAGADAAHAAAAARRELDRLLDGAGLDLPDDFGDRAEHFVQLLLDANARLNLTRITDPGAVARDHLLDALSALPILDRLAPERAVDLGSGGGVPGIVLAIARPGVAWTLVDSVRKKAEALRAFARELGLSGVTVRAERIEDLGRDPGSRAAFDVATARACAALPVLAELALPLVRIGGSVVAWKGPMGDDETAAGRRAASLLGGEMDVEPTPFAELGERRFVLIAKARPTPDAYPRRAGEPSRRPLG